MPRELAKILQIFDKTDDLRLGGHLMVWVILPNYFQVI